MPNKYQVGTVGGIRKVINVKAAASTATTIEGLENTSITLAQLKTLLGNTTTVQPTNPGTPSAGTQSLTVSNGTTSVANVTVIDVPSGINVSAPGGNTAVLAIPLPLTVTDGTHNETGVSTLLFQNAVNVTSTTAGQATVIMLPFLDVTDGTTNATAIGEIIFSGASVSTTSTNTSAVKVTITAGSLTVTDLSTVATSVTELIFSGASVSTTSTNTSAAKVTITGGGGSLTVTDGTHNVTSVTTLLFSGASVSTTGANEATVTVTGGSSSNVTPDTHPSSPTAYDDEFEAATLNTSLWSWVNQSSSTVVLTQGAAVLTPPVNDSNIHAIVETLPAGSWTFRAKLYPNVFGQYNAMGLILYESGTGKIIRYCAPVDSVTNADYQVDTFNSYSSFNSTLVNGALQDALRLGVSGGQTQIGPLYLQLQNTGTNYVFSVSATGYAGQFIQLYSSVIAGFFTTAADHIGLFALSQNGTLTPNPAFDWIRRTA